MRSLRRTRLSEDPRNRAWDHLHLPLCWDRPVVCISVVVVAMALLHLMLCRINFHLTLVRAHIYRERKRERERERERDPHTPLTHSHIHYSHIHAHARMCVATGMQSVDLFPSWETFRMPVSTSRSRAMASRVSTTATTSTCRPNMSIKQCVEVDVVS